MTHVLNRAAVIACGIARTIVACAPRPRSSFGRLLGRGAQATMLLAAASLFRSPTVRAAAPDLDAKGYRRAVAPREWSFPRDHGRHDGFKTEWWYFTGHLRDASGRRFGYQFTIFRSALTPRPATRPSAFAATD